MKTKVIFYRRALVMLVTFLMVFVSHTTQAQERWSFEFRPGVNFATKEMGEVNLNTGFGAEGTFAYRFIPHLSVYAGWSWNKFGSNEKINGATLDYEETGYTFGLQFIHPIGDSKINMLARAGGLSNHIEVEQGGNVIADSGHGFGWQVEGGLAIPIGGKWSLMPSVRYRSLSRDISIENVETSVDLNYLSVGLGLSFKF